MLFYCYFEHPKLGVTFTTRRLGYAIPPACMFITVLEEVAGSLHGICISCMHASLDSLRMCMVRPCEGLLKERAGERVFWPASADGP